MRRTKVACYNCKKGHRKCEDKRPCSYCLKTKKDCIDHLEKKQKQNVNKNQIGGEMKKIRLRNNDELKKKISPILSNKNCIINSNDNIMINKRNIEINHNNMMNELIRNYNNMINNNNHQINHNRLINNNPIGMNYNNNAMNNNQTEPNIFIHNFQIIKREEKPKSEEEKLKEEIIEIKNELDKIEKLDLPDDILKFDALELFLFQQQSNTLSPHFISPPPQSSMAGSMYTIGYFRDNLLPEDNGPHNFYLHNISEQLSLSFGYDPPQMIGSRWSDFSFHSFEINKELGKVRNKTKKNKKI